MTYTGPTSSLVNNIERISALPCAIPYSLLVKTAFPAALAAIWTVIEPDKKEAYHILRGKSLVCDAKGEISNIQRDLDIEPDVGTRTLFKFLEWEDLLLWFYFLGSVGKDFLVDWTSGIISGVPCQDRSTACTSSSGLAAIPSYPGAPWQGIEYNFDDGSPCAPRGFGSITLKPGEKGTLAGQVSFKTFFGKAVPTKSRIVNQDNGHVIDFYDPFVEAGDPLRPTPVWADIANNGHNTVTWTLEFQSDEEAFDNEVFPDSVFLYRSK